MPFKRHLVVLEALTPISHGDTLTGIDNATNTRLFMRSTIKVDSVPVRVPDISENALRSVMLRRPLHDHLLETLGIGPGDLPQAVVNLLYSGGNLAKGSSVPGNEMALAHEIRGLYPSLELLGGATDSFVLPKSRLRLAAWPVCREFAPYIRHVSPELAEEAKSVSGFDLLSEEVRVRGTGAESGGNQMLYSYECLAAGTKILVEITLDNRTPEPVEAAVAVALNRWDGYFGGQGRQGRGRMALTPDPMTISELPYIDHFEEHADKMEAGLIDGTLGTGKPVCILQ